MSKRLICCAITPALNKIVFEETGDIPLGGDSIMSACCREGVIREITPAQVVIAWRCMNGVTRTYSRISFGPVI